MTHKKDLDLKAEKILTGEKQEKIPAMSPALKIFYKTSESLHASTSPKEPKKLNESLNFTSDNKEEIEEIPTPETEPRDNPQSPFRSGI